MRKLISILTVLVLLISCMATVALATEENSTPVATISGSHKEALAGSTVSVNINVSEITYQDYGVYVYYDASALEVVDVVAGSASNGTFGFNAKNAGEIKAATMAAGEVTTSGTLFTITFKVSEDAAAGSVYYISSSVISVRNQADEYLNVGTSKGSITIVAPECEHEYKLVAEKSVASTCTEKGYEYYECSKCGDYYTKELELADHQLGGWVYDNVNYKKGHWHVCKVCGQEFDHAEHGDWTYDVLKEPTTEEDGLRKVTCGTCGWYYTEKIDKDKDDGGMDGYDITPMIALSVTSVVTLAGTSLYVFKRKTEK